MAVTVNERIDYFGQTVNIAARVQALADAPSRRIALFRMRRWSRGSAKNYRSIGSATITKIKERLLVK
jgi:class 3 adenylate cyclase